MNPYQIVDHGNACSLYVTHTCGHEMRYTMGSRQDAESAGQKLSHEECGVCNSKKKPATAH